MCCLCRERVLSELGKFSPQGVGEAKSPLVTPRGVEKPLAEPAAKVSEEQAKTEARAKRYCAEDDCVDDDHEC